MSHGKVTRKLGLGFGRRCALPLAALLSIPFACSTKSPTADPSRVTTTGGSGGGGGTGATGATSATSGGPMIDVDTPDTGPIENTGLGGAGGETSCAGEQHPAELVPLDIYVMLDRSLSMNGLTSTGDTKWQAITDALAAFVSDPSSDGIGIGIQYFPANTPCSSDDDCDDGACYLKACRDSRSPSDSKLPGLIPCVRDQDCPASGDSCVELGGCGEQSCVSVGATCSNDIDCTAVETGVCATQTVCTLSDYTTPAVTIGRLPDTKQDILDSLSAYAPAQNPFGLTPTGPALQGAIAYAQKWGAAHPARRSIVVLATDGVPTGGCSPSRRADIAALASVGAGATVPVQTYTIGVFSSGSADATEGPENIRAIARAGKGQAFVLSDEGDVAAQFVEALNIVRGHGLTCDYQLPTSGEAGKEVNYEKVNVAFTAEAGDDPETIPYLDDGSLCDERGGWYYATDPVTHKPTGIVACDATCKRLTSSVTGNIDIQVGCATARRDPK